ncbi:MAG TPA: hypothetical protein VJ723_12930 [Candidatus Angelobacter sp.]|nr:hypothetical protein [Candidatus Angelobacter sp.]
MASSLASCLGASAAPSFTPLMPSSTPRFTTFVTTGASFLTAFHPGSLGLRFRCYELYRKRCRAKDTGEQGESLSTRDALIESFTHSAIS